MPHTPLQPHLVQAFTAYFLKGKLISFFRCFRVLSESSCCVVAYTQLEHSCSARYKYKTHLRHPPPDCPCLLRSEVKRQIFFVLVVLAEVLARLLIHDSQDPGNRLPHRVTKRRLEQNYCNTMPSTYILVSFEADPPAIFWTRRLSSSFFKSKSCLDKSFFDLETSQETMFYSN
jgi:hypothetical protein